jgi:flagellar basal-body rod modification protein FlgD
MIAPVQNTTSTPATQVAAASAAANSQISATQDRFLALLVAQMKNQDPLNPLDNAQVTSQMAQLSTVSGIDKLNTTVQALSASMLASQSLQAVSMIGHPVLVPGSQIDLAGGKANAALNLTQPADSVKVTITDTSGKIVRTLQLGAQNTGMVGVQWDGSTDAGTTAADGSYKFSATAVLGGNSSAATTLSYGLVNSVAQTQSGVTVNVGQLGDISLTAIQQIL